MTRHVCLLSCVALAAVMGTNNPLSRTTGVHAQGAEPEMLDRALEVSHYGRTEPNNYARP